MVQFAQALWRQLLQATGEQQAKAAYREEWFVVAGPIGF